MSVSAIAPHRVIDEDAKDPAACESMVLNMKHAIAMCTEGYPTEHARGEFRFDAPLWQKCGKYFKQELDKKTQQVPGMFWNGFTEMTEIGQATFRIGRQGHIGCQPVIQWKSNMTYTARTKKWKVIAFRSKQKTDLNDDS